MNPPSPPLGSLDDFDIRINEGMSSHLFRHASEITKETKGGYLQGQINLPKALSGKAFYLRLALVPADIDPDGNPFHLHPNLLHVNMRTDKRARAKTLQVNGSCNANFTMGANARLRIKCPD